EIDSGFTGNSKRSFVASSVSTIASLAIAKRLLDLAVDLRHQLIDVVATRHRDPAHVDDHGAAPRLEPALLPGSESEVLRPRLPRHEGSRTPHRARTTLGHELHTAATPTRTAAE